MGSSLGGKNSGEHYLDSPWPSPNRISRLTACKNLGCDPNSLFSYQRMKPAHVIDGIGAAHLETLLALAECGSLSKAAARLFLTQSALSHQLKALESHCGAALVEKECPPAALHRHWPAVFATGPRCYPRWRKPDRDVARLAEGHAVGPCVWRCNATTASSWLMPAMDAYRSLSGGSRTRHHSGFRRRSPAASRSRWEG